MIFRPAILNAIDGEGNSADFMTTGLVVLLFPLDAGALPDEGDEVVEKEVLVLDEGWRDIVEVERIVSLVGY